jgi:thioredoxin 1
MSSDRPAHDSGTETHDELPDESAESPAEPIHVESAAHLDETVAAHDVVLVDFYADWCGPCKMIEPTVAALAAETDAAVAKVDVDAHQDLAAEYGVQGVPTLLLFADGAVAERMVGVKSRDTLVALVDRYSG